MAVSRNSRFLVHEPGRLLKKAGPFARCAALCTGPEFHSLDHIAPLASFLEMPLYVTDELCYALANRFYPFVETRSLPDLEFRLGEIAHQFDCLFECKYWRPALQNIFRMFHSKEMKLVFCPHGQSDKGFGAPLLAPYALQDRVLIYGSLMERMLRELSVWESIRRYAVVGNYRLAFYQNHQSFYDAVFQEQWRGNPRNKTLLYAPTWSDADDASSFFQWGAQVIEQKPDDWNLILKLHPLLEQRRPGPFYRLVSQAQNKPNTTVLWEFPPVYPVLAKADAFLGDASSVGYDFLYFERPLYFFPSPQPGRLRSCGQTLDPQRNLYSQLDLNPRYVQQQRELFQLAFGEPVAALQLRDRVSRLLS